MALTNNLKKQVDIPVWEWCRLAPAASSAISSTCTADNSLYHVTFGRYVYFMNSIPIATVAAGYSTGFFRYDTITDTYQILAYPPNGLVTYSAMQFAGGQGYNARVISAGTNTLQAAALTGKTLKGFDLRITYGAGEGQQRIVTDVANPVIAYAGTVTTLTTTPETNLADSNANWAVNQWVGYQVRFMHVSGQVQTRKIIYNTSTLLVFSDVNKYAEDQWAYSPVFSPAVANASPFVVAVVGTPYQIESSIITVDSPWLVQPDETSRFVVRSGGIWLNTSVAATSSYIMQYYDIAADQWYVRNACLLAGPVTAVGSEATIVNSGENATVFERGVALGTQSTTNLQDTTKSWTVNEWDGYNLRIFSGTGEGQLLPILSNTANSLTFMPAASLTPTSVTAASGVISTYIVTLAASPAAPAPVNCNGWSITGTGIGTGATIVSGQGTYTLVLSVVNSGAVSGTLVLGTSATGTNAQYTIVTSLPSPQNCNGWTVTGTNIGTGATVVSGQGTANLVLSVANAGTVSGIITMALTVPANSGTSGQYTITTSSAAPQSCNGWQISGTGIGTGATIVSGQGTTALTLSVANTASVTGTLTLALQPDATSHYFIDAFEAGYVTSVLPPSPNLATTATATAGVISTYNVTTSANTPPNCNGWYIFGTGITPGTTVSSGQGTKNLVLSATNTGAVSGILILSPTYVAATASSTCTINTYSLTLSGNSPANCNGWYIAGVGVGFGATIVSGQNTSTLTVSMINTATFTSGSLYLCPTAPVPNIFSYAFTGTTNTTINTSPTTTITPYNCNGWYASGTGIADGAIVTAGQGTNSLTLSASNTSGVSNVVTLSPTIATATASGGTAGNYTITTAANAPANCNGWYISGTGIAPGAVIISGQGGTTLTVSIANTGSVSGSLLLSATAVSTGSIVGGVFTAGATTGSYYPGQILLGSGIHVPTAITSPAGACYTTTAVTTVNFAAGNPLTMGIKPGMQVTFVAGTTGAIAVALGCHVAYTASSVTSNTVILSVAPGTTLGAATLQFGPAFVSDTGATSQGELITIATGNTTNLVPGMIVSVTSGTGVFAAGTYITQILSATTFTVSQEPTTQLTAAGNNFILFQPYQTMISNQLSGTPGGAGTYNIWPSQGMFGVGGQTNTGTGSSGSTSLTLLSNSPAASNGWTITGAGIAVGTTISSGQGTTSLTLSTNTTAAVSGTVTLSPPISQYPIIGMGNSILVDNSQYWSINRWNNQVVRIKAGTANGDLRSILYTVPGYAAYTSSATAASSVGTLVTLGSGSTAGLVVGMVVTVTTAATTGVFVYGTTVTAINSATQFTVSTVPTTALAAATVIGSPVNTLVTSPAWNTVPDTTSRYVIHGDADKNYMSFGGQTPTFVHNIEADTVTLGRMLDYGAARGTSAQYADQPPVALLAATPSFPVLSIASAYGFVASVATVVAGSSSSAYITTLVHLGGTFQIGSWITVAGTTVSAGESYNGTWQVIGSSPGSVQYYNNSGTCNGAGTVLQCNSVNLGGSLASGGWVGCGAATTLTLYGCVPSAYNATVTVAASAAAASSGGGSGSGTTITVTSTAGFKAGMGVRVTAGTGLFAAGTFIQSITDTTHFVVNVAPTTPLSGATVGTSALSASNAGYQTTASASSSSTTVTLSGSDTTTNLRIGMIPVVTAGTGTFASGTVISSITDTTHFVVTQAPSQALSGATITVVASFAWAGTIPGNMTTLGYIQKVPFAVTSGSETSNTCTLLPALGSPTYFPVGSWISVSGLTPGMYNGVFQVTASDACGSVSYTNPVSGLAAVSVVAGSGIGLATTTQLVNTVNPFSFKTGQYVAHRGDTGFSAANNNITAPITPVLMFSASTPFPPVASTQYAYPVAAPSGPIVNFPQQITLSSTLLCDAAKNWLPNQWAGCMVTYNSTQSAGTATQAAVTSGYVVSNTSNTLVIPNPMTAFGPSTGISRYVITAPANAPVQNTLGSSDSGLALGVQSATVLQDVTQGWVSPGGTAGILVNIPVTAAVNCTTNVANVANLQVGMTGIIMYSASGSTLAASSTIVSITLPTGNIAMSGNFTTVGTAVMLFGYGVASATAGGNTATLTLTLGLFVGMTAAVSSGSVTLAAGTTITAINTTTLVVTLSQNFGGTSGNAAILSFTAPCSSSGNVVTVAGYTTAGLGVGMYVGVLSAANLSAASTPTAGAFAPNVGANISQVTVTSILNANQFTVSAVPTVPLVNATVVASYWLPNQWYNRRVKLTSSLANYLEASCTGNNHNSLFVAITTPVSGASGYTILQQPVRSLGTALFWNYGVSDLTTRGAYLFQPRGGPANQGLPGWDRLDLRTDHWDFLMPTPSYEGLTTGAMSAYDGVDRIYFTTQASQRVYYLDLATMTIHGASQYPYAAGTVIPGNRFEIFETADGLRYLWLNRHSFQECFKQLLFY